MNSVAGRLHGAKTPHGELENHFGRLRPPESPASTGPGGGQRISADKEELSRAAARELGAAGPDVLAARDRDLGGGAGQSSGQPLPPSTATYFAVRYGHDFSAVRVHTEAKARADASRLHADAFTIGNDIHFAPDRYDPLNAAGRGLLAHELAHVVQQGGREPEGMTPDPSGEWAATEAARRVLSGGSARLAAMTATGPQLQAESAPHGVGGWLHTEVYEPLQRDYDNWMRWGITRTQVWGDKVPVLGHIAGVVGWVPYLLGGAGKIVVGVPQFLTPYTQEEHFLSAVSIGTATPAMRAWRGIRYGAWWVRRLFRKSPKTQQRVLKAMGPKGPQQVVRQATSKAPTKVKPVTPPAPPAARSKATKPAGPTDYSGMSDRKLRNRAKADKRAAEELYDRYLRMPNRSLQERARRGDGMAKSVLRHRAPSNEATLARALGSDYRPPHSAQVTVHRPGQGRVFERELTSGNPTDAERALGDWRKVSLATHTEARAVRQAGLQKGDVMAIMGQYDPCSHCRGAMRRAANETGATIRYVWMGGRMEFRPK